MNKQRIKSKAIFFAIILCLFGCNSSTTPVQFDSAEAMVESAKSKITSIEQSTLFEKMEEGEMFVLIDVREREEHDAGYIPGSVLIPRGVIEFRIINPEFWDNEGMYEPLKDESIILYCRSGNRSALAAEALEKLGFTNVYSLDEGFNGWKELHPELVELNIPPVDPSLLGPAEEETAGGSC